LIDLCLTPTLAIFQLYRGVTPEQKTVLKYNIKSVLPLMVPDLLYKMKMIFLRGTY